MATINENKDLLVEICDEWDHAEQVIKRAEMVARKVVIPSIFELRYAGRRIVDALNGIVTGATPEKITELLLDAKFNCLRAQHDAVDAATSKIAFDIDIMGKKLGYDAILKAYPEFSNFRQQLISVQNKIAESRGDRYNREAIYQALEKDEFKRLVQAFYDIQVAEPIMKSLAKRERLISWGGIAGIVIGVISVGVSILIAITD